MTKGLQDYYKDLGFSESSGKYNIENKYGYLGKYQMGASALQEAGYYVSKDKDDLRNNHWNGTFTGKDGVYSKKDYLNNSAAQENAVNNYNKSQWKQIKSYGIDKYIGKKINGITITPSGILAAAHLKGVAGISPYFKSDGKIIPHDANYTTIEERLYNFMDYNVSEITGIKHKNYDISAFLEQRNKNILKNVPKSIYKKNKNDFSEGNPAFLKEVEAWNDAVIKEHREYLKQKEAISKDILKRKQKIKNKDFSTGFASNINSKHNEVKQTNSSDNWSEKQHKEFLEGFNSNKFASPEKYPYRNTKPNWTDKFNIGNPETDDGHRVTLDNGKHLFIKD